MNNNKIIVSVQPPQRELLAQLVTASVPSLCLANRPGFVLQTDHTPFISTVYLVGQLHIFNLYFVYYYSFTNVNRLWREIRKHTFTIINNKLKQIKCVKVIYARRNIYPKIMMITNNTHISINNYKLL